MKISIILAIYNEDKNFEKCIISLINQIDIDYEIIIIDDGSTKQIRNPKLETRNNKIRWYQIEHSGPATARNFGAKRAKGEILAFLDGDMIFEPDFLKNLCQPIFDNLAKGTFSNQEYMANWDKQIAKFWNWENGIFSRKRITSEKNMVRDFRSILKTEFDKVGGFDNTGYTDTWSLSEKLGYLPIITKAKYYHFNPETYRDVFNQAKWIGGRERKLGWLGKISALIRSSFIISLIIALYKAIKYQKIKYFLFKIIYDYGIFLGILNSQKKK